MDINFHDIPTEGLHLEKDLSDGWVREMVAHLGNPKEFKVVVDLDRLNKSSIHLAGKFSGTVVVACDRCLEEFDLRLSDPNIHALIQLHPGSEKHRARKGEEHDPTLPQEDDSTFWVKDPKLNVAAVLQEYVELAMPYKRLCNPDCKGLCDQCGKNLNEGKCGCVPITLDDEKPHPFKALEALRDLGNN